MNSKNTCFLDQEKEPCPFCGAQPKFHFLDFERECNCIRIFYNFGCEKCEIYTPKGKLFSTYRHYVAVSLSDTGEITINHDDRKQDILSWNSRYYKNI